MSSALSGTDSAAPVAESQDTCAVVALTRVLARATRALGEAGRPTLASRLAAEAWSAVRHTDRGSAERLTGTLHYLARLRLHSPMRKEPMSAAPSTDDTLDVRADAPARRHELIFATWRELAAGEAFVLVNDHDPKPLYYQFAAEHADEFSWDYLEEGPEVWRVRIGRTA